ncbi:MAG: hypothetical protein WC992_00405 [Acholeplasmataceae bacterium]
MAKTPLARGGRIALGPPKAVLEMDIGAGRRYDPSRDILHFLPGMFQGINRTFFERAWPRIAEELPEADDDRFAAVGNGMISLAQALLGQKSETGYDGIVKDWLSRTPPEVSDLILKVFGRAVLQFYVECVLNVKRPEAERWPFGAEEVFLRIAEHT